MQWLTLNVKHKGKEKKVLIPDMGDKAETEYLIEAEQEKTIKQIDNEPERPAPRFSKEDIGGALKEYNEYRKRKREDVNKKYW